MKKLLLILLAVTAFVSCDEFTEDEFCPIYLDTVSADRNSIVMTVSVSESYLKLNYCEFGAVCTTSETPPSVSAGISAIKTPLGREGMYQLEFSGSFSESRYYVHLYTVTHESGKATYHDYVEVVMDGVPDIPDSDDFVNLSANGTANCYIVNSEGKYKFRPVMGNSGEVLDVKSVEVLWESYGTDETPEVGALIPYAEYRDLDQDGYFDIYFNAADRKGNAVIAAKDVSGTILWSWHIWLTDQPTECVYANDAGTMMDRNLGATSATPGDVGALGLLYQWGRKDPFLGSSSISSDVEAKSTITWPSAVISNSSTGTISYATQHPTTFITSNSSNDDWYYSGSSNTDNTRWQSKKTIYDPCPAGWRVPDGGSSGVWAQAGFDDQSYDSSDEGMLFGSGISSPASWYPAAGCRREDDRGLRGAGNGGIYWSVTPNRKFAYNLSFDYDGYVNPTNGYYRAYGQSVRCMKEGTGGGTTEPEVPAVDLSESGTANSYIVSEEGAYKFRSVQGNSGTSVGKVASAEVLWESFGTSEVPAVGDLVKNVSYKDGYIAFATNSTFKEGNAVIAAKDVSGNILWSWHIWLTDQPAEQVYYNNAGTMMDRNLGATSATPGDVGALGLLYQWGRKDPFLGSSSISESVEAKSTGIWPAAVESDDSQGTEDYSVKYPTTFISYNKDNYDWYYTGSSLTDNTRWQSVKTIYDPCPVGWRVPDGGESGVWAKADFQGQSNENNGKLFTSVSSSSIWYPATGYKSPGGGGLSGYRS